MSFNCTTNLISTAIFDPFKLYQVAQYADNMGTAGIVGSLGVQGSVAALTGSVTALLAGVGYLASNTRLKVTCATLATASLAICVDSIKRLAETSQLICSVNNK